MDQILDNFVGGHGKYQIAITISTSLINEFANGIFLMHLFTAYAPKHRCRVPQCETINATKVRIGNRDAPRGGAGGAAAPPDFGRSEGAL